MGSWGVHGVLEKVCNVVMRVHKAGVTGTGRSGTRREANSGFQHVALFLTSQRRIKVFLFSSFLHYTVLPLNFIFSL